MRFAAFDLMIHTWDLATTLGEEPGIADDLVGEVDGFARRVLDAAPRDGINFGTAGAGSRNRDPPRGARRVHRPRLRVASINPELTPI